jgi:hypothetical protein
MKYKFLIIMPMLFLMMTLLGATDLPKVKLPILTTSAGQSADINTVNIIFEEAEIGFDYCDVPPLSLVKSGVGLNGKETGEGFHVEIATDLNKFKSGTPYQTIAIAIGASLKGMGASGLTIEDEIKRVKSIIDYCKKNKIFIIALHVGGVSKRGAEGGDNERMIDAVAPFADYIIVVKDSNKDGKFTKITRKNKIPFTEVENALEIVGVFNQIFK